MNFALGAFLLSLVSFFVSATAIVVSIRRHRHSIRPYINMVHEATAEYNKESQTWVGNLNVLVINNGTGPALIDSFELFVDSKPIEPTKGDKWTAAISKLFPVDGKQPTSTHFAYNVFNLDRGYCIPSKEKLTVFTIKFTMGMSDYIIECLERSRSVIVYKAFYGGSYTYDSEKEKLGIHDPFK